MSGLLEQLSIEKDSTGAICLRDFRMKAYSNTKDTRNLNDLLPDGYGVYSNAGLGWLSLSVASANFADKGEVIPAVSGILGGKNIVIPKNSQTLPAELSFQVSDKVVSNFKGVQIKWYNVKSSGTRTLLATETQYNAVKEDGSYVRNTEPVSYTHLDVYKRQGYNRVARIYGKYVSCGGGDRLPKQYGYRDRNGCPACRKR